MGFDIAIGTSIPLNETMGQIIITNELRTKVYNTTTGSLGKKKLSIYIK